MSGLSRAKTTWYTALIVLIISTLALAQGSLAQGDPNEVLVFEDLGRSVRGEFREFFLAHGGVRVFGFPITEAYIDPTDGRYVQYFQNARLEIDPADGQVRMSAFDEDFITAHMGPAITPAETPAGGQFFEPTLHSVQGEIRAFYLEHGGPDVFGYPISELEYQDDRLVQYFERCVLEWWPELPKGHNVQLSPWGEIRFYATTQDSGRKDPIARPRTITAIQVSAAVHSPIMGLDGGSQTLSVFVGNQIGQPLVGAQVQVMVMIPNNRLYSPTLLTDQFGMAVFSLDIPPQNAGAIIPIQVATSYQMLWKETATAFRVWW